MFDRKVTVTHEKVALNGRFHLKEGWGRRGVRGRLMHTMGCCRATVVMMNFFFVTG